MILNMALSAFVSPSSTEIKLKLIWRSQNKSCLGIIGCTVGREIASDTEGPGFVASVRKFDQTIILLC